MKITLDEIEKTAKLAKFNITREEAALYSVQLSAVLDWVEELKNLDIRAEDGSDIGPAAPLRDDEPALSPARAEIMSAFNDGENNCLKVKKVL